MEEQALPTNSAAAAPPAAPNSSSSMTLGPQLSRLPHGLLTDILKRVPQQQRLCDAASAHSAFAQAAAAATVSLVCRMTHQKAQELEAWLRRQPAGQIESLDLHYSPDETLPVKLPWQLLSGLQRLELYQVELPALEPSTAIPAATGSTAHSSSALTPPLLPKLQQLPLSCCCVSAELLLQLANPQLTSLDMRNLDLTGQNVQSDSDSDSDGDSDSDSGAAIRSLLQRLPHLKFLSVCSYINVQLTCDVLQPMSSMQQLQDISLTLGGALSSSFCANLPTSITSLHLTTLRRNFGADFEADTIPTVPTQLQSLTNIQHLDLEACTFEPALLGSFSKLQDLRLDRCFLLPWGGQGRPQPDAIAALLSALPLLTALQNLQLHAINLDAARAPHQHFSALTASSQLTGLSLQSYWDAVLPAGAIPFMFPAGRQLPALCKLSVTSFASTLDPGDNSACCLDGQDLACVVNSCPALTALDVSEVLYPGSDLSALLRLPTSCSSLAIGGSACTHAATASVLVRLTQLTSLKWHSRDRLWIEAYQQLTALQGLCELHVEQHGSLPTVFDGVCIPLWWANGKYCVTVNASEAKGLVWEQLRSLCDNAMQAVGDQPG